MTSFVLKLIAIITMVIDHVGLSFFPQEQIFRDIGRIAFPIFCFLIAEGYVHTKSVKKYALRIFLFALLSEVPFDVMLATRWSYSGYQNVMFTLLLGVFAIWCFDYFKDKNKWLGAFGVLTAAGAAFFFRTDYGMFGVMLIFACWYFRENRVTQLMFMALFMALNMQYSLAAIRFSICEPLALIPLYFYNNKPGQKGLKYLFYAFYPLHMGIIVLIKFYEVLLNVY